MRRSSWLRGGFGGASPAVLLVSGFCFLFFGAPSGVRVSFWRGGLWGPGALGVLWCPVVPRGVLAGSLGSGPGCSCVLPPLVGVVRGSLGSAGCGLLFFRVRRVRSPGPPGSVLGPGLGTPTGKEGSAEK